MQFNVIVLKKTLLFLVGFFLAIYLLVLIVLPNVLDINNYKSIIEKQVQNYTGLKFSVENMELKTKFSPYINVYAYHARLLYPDNTTCFKVTDANIKIKVLPLLFKKIELKKIILQRPVLSLSIMPNGATSLDKYIIIMNNSAKNSAYKTKNNIPEIVFYNYKIKIKDGSYYYPFIMSGKELKLSDIILGDSLHFLADGALTYNNKKFIDYNLDVLSPVTFDKKQIFNVNPFQNIYKYNLCAKLNAKLKYEKKQHKEVVSGKVDLSDLSFTINNKLLSGNFINLGFDDNNIVINAKLKTSPSEVASISGKYSYGIAKKLKLNVKAANSDLSNLSELLNAIFISFNIKNKFSEYKVSGFANFNFNVDTDFKKLYSDGVATLKNVSIKNKKYPFSVTDINSEISFKNNFINIISSSAFINNTPVKIKGSFDSDANVKMSVSADDLNLKAVTDAFLQDKYKKTVSLSGGNLSFIADVSGKMDNLILKTSVTVKNLALKYISENIDINTKSANIIAAYKNKKVNISSNLYNLYAFRSDFRFPLTSEHLTFVSDGESIDLKNSKVKWNFSDFILSGGVKNIQKIPDIMLKIRGNVYSADLYNLLKLSIKMQASPKGKIPFVAEINSKENKNKIEAQFFSNAENYLSYMVIKELLHSHSVLNLSLVSEGKALLINDCSLYNAKSLSKYDDLISTSSFTSMIAGFKGEVDMGASSPVIKNGEFIVPESLTASVIGFNNSEVSIKSDITLDGRLDNLDLKGNIFINSLNIPDYRLKLESGSLVLGKDKGSLKLPNISVGNSKFNISSNLILPLSSDIVLSDTHISSSYVDLDDLTKVIFQFNKYLPGIKLPLEVKNGNLSIDNLRVQDITASNISSYVLLNNNILHLTKMTSDAYNGKVSGDLSINLPSTLATLNLRGISLDGAPAMTAITGIKDDLSGKLDFYSNVSFRFGSRYEQLQSLKGNFNFAAYNGKLKTLGSFEHFLYAQNLISQSIMKASINLISKAVAPKNTGLFKALHGNISFYSGYANIKSLRFSGPNMSMYMEGKFNMLNNIASVDIIGKVSNEIVGVLGPFGDLSLSNLVSSSSSTPLPNIFFSRYNQKISRSEYGKIPPLVPETNLKTKPFSVNIIGPVESVKSVKSFKWLVVSDSPESQNYTESSKEETYHQTKQLQREYSTGQPSNELPSFLDKLPDEIKN